MKLGRPHENVQILQDYRPDSELYKKFKKKNKQKSCEAVN